MPSSSSYRLETVSIHAGQANDPFTGAVITPIYQTTTFAQDELPESSPPEWCYTRSGNPTRAALEANLAALEGGRFGLAFSSGLAAANAVLQTLSSGDHVVASQDLYGGCYRIFTKIFSRFGVKFSLIDTTDPRNVAEAITPFTKLVWLETPSNPLLKITDLRACAAIARSKGIIVLVDNTFATPVFQRPLELGADIVLHSTTKYIGGHCDVLGGALIVNDQSLFESLKFVQNATGGVPGPQDCFLQLRGIKTLALRVKQHAANAQVVAEFLDHHPDVNRVIFPGLESHPQHGLAKAQATGFGSIVSVEFNGGIERIRALVNHLRLWPLAESLGGVKSLLCHPTTMTHASVDAAERARVGIGDGLVRLSVGLEHVDDLIADLDEALRNPLAEETGGGAMTTLINRSWPRSSTARNLNDRTFAEQSTGVKTIRVGLLGCGTVGREIASQLTALDQRRAISDRARTKLTRILVRDSKRNRGLDPAKFATTIDEIFADKPDVIIEAIGGIDPARAFVEAALRRGISVITANKTLIAHEGDRLRAIAKRHRTALFCEACVGGAVPILAALKQLRGDRIRSIRGIINGTCNDVLSRMINERLTLHESLQLSIRAGLAEPDPSADISGRDSAEKLCVLAAAAGIGGVTPDQVETAGIESITLADIDAARSHGYVIKLVAELAKEGDGFRAHVGPALVSKRDPLARATGPQNVFVVDSELAGTLILQGAGAGPKPTASAILGDLQRAVAIESGTIESAPGTIVATDALRRRFARITGFRGRITPEEALSAFASHEVEIHHILVQADAIEVFTGPVHTAALAKACRSFEPNARLLIADVIA